MKATDDGVLYSNIRKVLMLIAVICLFGYMICLNAEAYIVADIFSPLCCLAVMLTVFSVAGVNRKYRLSILFLASGALFWFLGDFFYGLYYEGICVADIIDQLSVSMYENTSYVYLIGILSFIWVEYKNESKISLTVNAFLYSVGVYVITTSVFGAFLHRNFNIKLLQLKNVINIFVAMLIVVLMLMIVVEKGVEKQTLTSICILVSLAIYGLLDIRYTYIDAAGIEADSTVVDTLFLVSIVLMGFAFANKYSESGIFKEKTDNTQKDGSLGIVISTVMFVFGLLLFVAGAMRESNFLILFISTIAYFLVIKVVQVNDLNKKLIAYQKREKEELQNKVAIQQKELSNVNAKLEDATTRDMLTGLHNRSYWKTYSKEAKNYKNGRIILYSLDVNYFKVINDTYGHTAGDQVLMQIAERLKNLQDENIEIFRFGGDQFLVAYCDKGTNCDVEALADSLIATFEEPIETGSGNIQIDVSIGIAIYPENTNSLEKLLNYAESAKNTIKHNGKESAYAFFNADNMPKIQRKLTLEQKLHQADFDKDFFMYYQPQVDAKTGKLIGMEALVRWVDRDLGFISPAEFIPIAEEVGVMSSLGQWISLQSLKQINTWNEEYGKNLTVGINVSPIQMQEDSFVDRFVNSMKLAKVHPEWVDIEITEGIALNGNEKNNRTIERLKEAGVSFSVDDFGTGYAAFSNMLNFSFDRIKIAKELIDDLASNNHAKVIVGAIISMAKGMELTTIAEGVETKEQLDILVELGCQQIQGYYFGRPIPAEEFEDLWLKHNL